MSPESALFRHAVRMSLALRAGYALIQFTGFQHGCWILLTSLFVCQPNYNTTRHRLALRIIGTLVGVVIGLPTLLLVPSIEGQLVLIVFAGVPFFAFRNVQYVRATMFIALLVLLCFNPSDEGFKAALLRITDTLTGCAIAWAAVNSIRSDWRFRNLPCVLDRAMNADCRYLDTILEQYHQGHDNRLTYRVAHHDAYNRDTELAFMVSNLLTEPCVDGIQRETAFRLLCLDHTFADHISTLGAHREELSTPDTLVLLDDVVCYVDDTPHHTPADEHRVQKSLTSLQGRIQHLEPHADSKEPLVSQQIGLLPALLPEVCRLQQRVHTQTE